jgi:hypothetical protein
MTTQDAFTLEKLDQQLARLPAAPVTDADLDARATLMARRITLDQAIKAEAQANKYPQPRGNLVVYVPPEAGTSHFYSNQNATNRQGGSAWGRVVQSRVTEDGRVALDLFPQEFRDLLGDKRFGQLWQLHNPEAMHTLGQSQ